MMSARACTTASAAACVGLSCAAAATTSTHTGGIGWRVRLRDLAGVFAIDVVAYAIMSNHLHVLLWTDPERAAAWDDLEVARRWLTLFPGPSSEENAGPDEAALVRQ